MNKIIPIFVISLLFVSCASIPESSAPYSEEKSIVFTNLIWSDEFDGDSLDLNNWNYVTGTGAEEGLVGWGNNELEYYTERSQNVDVKDGELIITALKERYRGSTYTSGKISTKKKIDLLYGRIEARIQLPAGRGIWPAFWMLPTYEEYGTWARSGEIDIVEMVGHEPETIHGTIHWGYQWPDNKRSGRKFRFDDKRNIAGEYHVYAIEWNEEGITWYIDDIQYSYIPADEWVTFTEDDILDDPNAPFDKRFHMILNLAVGGNWPGNPNDKTEFPSVMKVDYVRVYR